MDRVEGLLKNLKLSVAEKKGVWIMMEGVDQEDERAPPQAVGKVFSEKRVRPESLVQALGNVWCPLNSLECSELGENRFLFTFHQPMGKKKALEDGPWMLSNEVIVVVDIDDSKTLEELEFTHIPIWARISNLPMGMMNRMTGEAIGNEIGEFVEADVGSGGKAVGAFLRIKIRLDIRTPLMRGVTVLVGKKGEEVEHWCPLVYEFLPDFCFVCGLIGHTEKTCSTILAKGENRQYA